MRIKFTTVTVQKKNCITVLETAPNNTSKEG